MEGTQPGRGKRQRTPMSAERKRARREKLKGGETRRNLQFEGDTTVFGSDKRKQELQAMLNRAKERKEAAAQAKKEEIDARRAELPTYGGETEEPQQEASPSDERQRQLEEMVKRAAERKRAKRVEERLARRPRAEDLEDYF